MHRDDVYRLIEPTGLSPTIGERNMNLRRMPVWRKLDFFDKSGRLHGLIVLVPILYAFMQTQRGEALSSWFWWITLGIVGFALFARRPPYVRLGPGGISFPEKKSSEFLWDRMVEARAKDEELDILMEDEQHVTIAFRKLRRGDSNRIKRLIQAQFQAMAERAKALEDEAARLDEAA
jgi:hypothetical protein